MSTGALVDSTCERLADLGDEYRPGALDVKVDPGLLVHDSADALVFREGYVLEGYEDPGNSGVIF